MSEVLHDFLISSGFMQCQNQADPTPAFTGETNSNHEPRNASSNDLVNECNEYGFTTTLCCVNVLPNKIDPNRGGITFDQRIVQLSKAIRDVETGIGLCFLQETGTTIKDVTNTIDMMTSSSLGLETLSIPQHMSGGTNRALIGWDSNIFQPGNQVSMEVNNASIFLRPEYEAWIKNHGNEYGFTQRTRNLMAFTVEALERFQARLIKHKRSGVEFLSISLHNPWTNRGTEKRPVGLQAAKLNLAIFLYLARYNGNVPLVIGGDFNCEIFDLVEDLRQDPYKIWKDVCFKVAPEPSRSNHQIDAVMVIWTKEIEQKLEVKHLQLIRQHDCPEGSNVAHPLLLIFLRIAANMSPQINHPPRKIA